MTPHRTGESADKQPHTAEPIKPPVTQQLSLPGLPSVRPGSGIGKAGKFPASWEKYREFCSLGVLGPSKCIEWLSNFKAVLGNSLSVRTGNFLRLNRELDRVIREYSGRLGKSRFCQVLCMPKASDNQKMLILYIFRHFLMSLPTCNTFTSVLMPQICGRRKFLKGQEPAGLR